MSHMLAANWDRSRALVAWSRVLVAHSRRLARPAFRGGSDVDDRLAGIRVIVVDDDEDNADVFSTFLRACGATVVTARSGAEALVCLDREPIDLLLTDVAMPHLSGIDLLRRVRAHPRHATMPAIVMSGYPERDFALDAGRFSAFMLKPVELDELAAMVKRLVAGVRG